jgi:HK97 family phage prohead protease
MNEQRKMFQVQAKALGERQVETIISTAAMDRDGDTIDVAGWDLTAYRKNPVVLLNHDPKSLPVARSLSIAVNLQDGTLRTVDEFPPPGVYPVADQVCALVKSGFIHSKSVGFRPLEWEPNATGGHRFLRQELLEHSFVTVPSNPDALVVARSKGVDRPALDAWLGRAASDGPGRDAVAHEHLAAVKSWLGGSAGRRGETVLVLRDDEATRSGVVIDDYDPTRFAKAARGNERVSFDEDDFKAAFARVISAAMVEPLRRARMRVTGRVD